MCNAINSLLELGSPAVRPVNVDAEALYTAREVFPESSPGNRLRGLRTREGLTQKELAKALGIRQHHVSKMENGLRSISRDMVKRIDTMYNISYQAFL